MSSSGFRLAWPQLGYNSKAIRDIVGPVTKEKAEKGGESFQHVGPVEGELMKTLHEDGMGVKKLRLLWGGRQTQFPSMFSKRTERGRNLSGAHASSLRASST